MGSFVINHKDMSSTEEKVIDAIDSDDNIDDNDDIIDTNVTHPVIERPAPDERSRRSSVTGLTWKVASTAKRASETTKKSNEKSKAFYGIAFDTGSTFDLDGSGEIVEPSEPDPAEDDKDNEDAATSQNSNSEQKENGSANGSWHQQRPALTRQFTAYSELCCCVI